MCRIKQKFHVPRDSPRLEHRRKWILNDRGLSETWDELDMQENTDRAGVCRSSEVTAPVIKDAAMYAIFPGSVSCLPSVGVWTHSWFKTRGPRVCVGCSCMLVWILSSSGLLNGIWSALLLIHYFSAEKLMAAARLGAAERVEISRHSRLRWLTELQAAVYQLQLQLSGRRKRRVTLTAPKFLTTLSEQMRGSPTKQQHFSQGDLGEGEWKFSFVMKHHVAVVGI